MHDATTQTKRVGIWIRVSTDDQASGDSPEIHEHRARSYAEFSGWTVVEVYNLAGVSGKSVWEHSECQRMLKDIKRGHVHCLLFSKLARLARNTKELLDFADHFKAHGAALVSIEEKIDTSTAAGMLFYTMLGAFATFEREEIVGRLNSSIATRAKMGKILTGRTPYGFSWTDKKLVQIPEEADIRRQAFELFIQHRRLGVVARILNGKGYRSRGGFKFRDIAISRMLTCTSAKGTYVFNTRKTGSRELKPQSEWGSIPCVPIVSEEVFDQVSRIMEEQKKPQRKVGKKPAQIFTGLLRCGCGCRMYVYTRSPNYTCNQCKNKIGIAAMEEIFVGAIRDSLADTGRIAVHLTTAQQRIKERQSRVALLKEQVDAVSADMKRTYELYLAGGVGVDQFKSLNGPLVERLTQLNEELPRLEGEISALQVSELSADVIAEEASNLAALWPTLDIEGKQRLAALICREIIVPNDDPDAPIDITFSHTPPGAPPEGGNPGSGGGSRPPAPPEGGISDPSSNRLNTPRNLRGFARLFPNQNSKINNLSVVASAKSDPQSSISPGSRRRLD